MSSVKRLRAPLAALVVLFLLNSCTDFFTTSWGELFKRDPAKVKVTSSNVYDLLDAARVNPELARAILDQINANSNDTLKHAAIRAANQAAGLTTLALENVKTLIDAMDSKDPAAALREAMDNIKKGAQGNDIGYIAGKLKDILIDEVVYANPIEAGRIIASVPKNGGGNASLDIKINNNSKTATVKVDDVSQEYPCEITSNGNGTGTIILKGAKEGGGDAVIRYTENNDNTLDMTGLEQIRNAGLAGGQVTSETTTASGKPEFKEGFLDDVPDSDLTLMVMTLILAKAEKVEETMTIDEYFETWPYKNLETGKGIDDEEAIIAATVNGMIDRGEDTSELTNMIKDLLGVE